MENNPKYPWGHNRRFNDYTGYFRKRFGGRVQKLSVDAGFTCPNRDGSKGTGGCTFCVNDAFSPSYCHPAKSVQQQLLEGKEFHEKRYRRASKYLAYFQAYSNTYGEFEKLVPLYEEALQVPEVIGLIIGTRPDCIDEQKLAYFRSLSERYYISIEYGIESCYDKTLKRINRGHTFSDSIKALNLTAKYGLPSGAHMIFGLPGETVEEMLGEAGILSGLPIKTLKFHQLQILRNTAMVKEFEEHPDDFVRFSLEDYMDFIIKFVERLNPEFIIERFAGEVPPSFLYSEGWGEIRYDRILSLIEQNMMKKDTWQGKKFRNS
jgi:hypothetical protein